MDRWLCIHSHFYQPPRENPWLEHVETQDSAYPFHDWNERISAECYERNALSRVLDRDGWVTRLVNNYAKISFNFGPTLLSWLEDKDPKTYEAILEGDRLSRENFSGHGSAIAQAYNHIIMPLATRRDKETQIVWGIRDFERRFGREPESLWLPETAVDLESLEIMAAHGMKYVILAPRQAERVRPLGETSGWHDASHEKVDPKRPYLVRLPGGKSIAAFFYDGPVSRAVAFEGLLHNGERFAERLVSAFDNRVQTTQLAHIATDGETYGHHHLHGEMALSYALHYVESRKLARLTNYGEFLELHPPEWEATIYENSSWSCAHGIERWRSDCGCNTGGRPEWNQKWRAPFRAALDDLHGELTPRYEELMADLTEDPWAVRNAYIDVVLDRSEATRAAFVEKWALLDVSSDKDKTRRFIKALEMQRQLLLMYTSCAWFFDEVSGIETVQNMKYAYRAMQLAEDLFGQSWEERFKERLSLAASNQPDVGTAKEAYVRHVEPARLDLLKVGAHFAITSLFEDTAELTRVYCYEVDVIEAKTLRAGKVRMGLGIARIASTVTLDEVTATFGVIHFGDHNISAGIREYRSREDYESMVDEASTLFGKADLPNLVRLLDKHFGAAMYSVKSLFKDQQAKILKRILASTLREVQNGFGQLYDSHYPLMCYLSDLDVPLPSVFLNIAEFVQNSSIKRELSQAVPDTRKLDRLISEARHWRVNLDQGGLSRLVRGAALELMQRLEADAADDEVLSELVRLVQTVKALPFPVDLWSVQNEYYRWCQRLIKKTKRERPGDHAALGEIGQRFRPLGQELRVRCAIDESLIEARRES